MAIRIIETRIELDGQFTFDDRAALLDEYEARHPGALVALDLDVDLQPIAVVVTEHAPVRAA